MAKRVEPVAGRISCLILAVVFAVGLIYLGARLREVQVEGAADYGYASDRQSVRRVRVAGPRGRIIDRNGTVLADNRPSVSIVCLPERFQKRTWDATVDAISQAVAVVAERIGAGSRPDAASIRKHVNQSPSMPMFVWRDIGERELAVFSENELDFPGFSVAETEERIYPAGGSAAHLIGYVGRDRGDSEAGDEKFNFYTKDMVGRAGIELYYDTFLRGVAGEKKLQVDARGFATREWTVTEPRPGPDLRLTVDLGIQRTVEAQLRGERGACVVIDPRNGEVLAMASAPGFDPNAFVPTLHPKLYERLATDPAKPLLNRACGGAYAPGSTFKPVTALAGMSVGFSDDTRYDCSGAYELGQMHLRCASRWGHGTLDMREALMKSCNPYFCNLAATIGSNAVMRAARAFGLGAKTGIDFGIDMAGVVPDAEWKMRTYHERWYVGDLLQMSIGQGMLLVSPLQMARLAGAIGTGRLTTPHLKFGTPCESHALPFTEEWLAVVRDGMRMVVAGNGVSRGTGWRAGDGVQVSVSAKTGTAEVGEGERRRKNVWLIAYAPSEAPQVAVALVVEDGMSGGGTAAPKVGEILKEVFRVR